MGESHLAQADQQGVVVISGKHRDGQLSSPSDHLSDVDALAAGIVVGRDRPKDSAPLQGFGECDRAVDARVRR